MKSLVPGQVGRQMLQLQLRMRCLNQMAALSCPALPLMTGWLELQPQGALGLQLPVQLQPVTRLL